MEGRSCQLWPRGPECKPGEPKGGVASIDHSCPDLEGEVVIISQSLDGREGKQSCLQLRKLCTKNVGVDMA